MNPKKMESLSYSPIVRAFVLSILKIIIQQKISHEKVERINTALIPKISEAIIMPRMIAEKKIMPGFSQKYIQQPAMSRTFPVAGNFSMPERYNLKIEGLFRDPAVSAIECPGENKYLLIIRAGRKMSTKILLSKEEINLFLERVAAEARIPLIEGVFRAAVDNFVVNAVVSEEIGSRFIANKIGFFNR